MIGDAEDFCNGDRGVVSRRNIDTREPGSNFGVDDPDFCPVTSWVDCSNKLRAGVSPLGPRVWSWYVRSCLVPWVCATTSTSFLVVYWLSWDASSRLVSWVAVSPKFSVTSDSTSSNE